MKSSLLQRMGCPSFFALLFLVAIGHSRLLFADDPARPPAKSPKPTEQVAPRTPDSEQPLTVQELTRRARASIVVVSFTGRDGKRVGLGSGFVVAADGLIATNLHVIGEGREINVELADGRNFPVTAVHATSKPLDLAILRIDATKLKPLPLGDSESLRQGQDVVALGNPVGLKFSVVSGVVSGFRELDGKPMIQLAIPIEPGNSGGPLLDRFGRVHGILTMKSLVTRNLGFAVVGNALKPLLAKPNPIPMEQWLTVGRLSPREWNTHFGARWRQRAGRIQVAGKGDGFGGRSLALSTETPNGDEYEVQVAVKLDSEDGAAGLTFFADGNQKHYGFYPSAGNLRFSRFDGPDVFSWQVLEEIKTPHYRPGEWNVLKVRVTPTDVSGFVNDQLVVTRNLSARSGQRVGLAKFRDTEAEFKSFVVGKRLPPTQPQTDQIAAIVRIVEQLPLKEPAGDAAVKELRPLAQSTTQVLNAEAAKLESRAKRLRELAQAVHEDNTREQLAAVLKAGSDKDPVDLIRASLLIARLDNHELDVDAYCTQVDRMAAEIQTAIERDLKDSDNKSATELQRLQVLDRYLFAERGFHGSRTNYYHRSNSYLNEVIDDREGLPIMLSVLYAELARKLDVSVVGVGLPGHFVVRFKPSDKQAKSQLIDPFEQGERLTKAAARKRIEQAVGQFDAEFLKAQTSEEILARMLTNLMNVARDNEDPQAMLRYVETLLVIRPDDPTQRWLRGVLRYQTQRFSQALVDVEWLLQQQPDNIDMARVRHLQGILQGELENK